MVEGLLVCEDSGPGKTFNLQFSLYNGDRGIFKALIRSNLEVQCLKFARCTEETSGHIWLRNHASVSYARLKSIYW